MTLRVQDLVIGAGFTGLYAAARLCRQGRTVAVVESAPTAGGLMRSHRTVHAGHEVRFDIGTHFLLLTGEPELDAPFLEAIDPDRWRWFSGPLAEGQISFGKVRRQTGCLDLTGHPQIELIRSQFLQSPGGGDKCKTLHERWVRDFGVLAASEVLPALAQKFTGKLPEDLAQGALDVFVPSRVRLFDGLLAAKKKQDPGIDRRLAFGHRNDGPGAISKAYPNEGGIGLIVENMIACLLRQGGSIHTGAQIHFVGRHNEEGVSAAVMKTAAGETRLEYERIVSGLAPVLLGRLLGVQVPTAPYAARDLVLVHFVAEREDILERELYWLTVYDADLSANRITLYPNFSQSSLGCITVEVPLAPESPLPQDLVVSLAAMLQSYGLVSKSSALTPVAVQREKSAFPVLLPGWPSAMAAQSQALCASVPKLVPVAAAAGTPFGQLAMIRDVAQRLG